jgi:hypothetical protein
MDCDPDFTGMLADLAHTIEHRERNRFPRRADGGEQ